MAASGRSLVRDLMRFRRFFLWSRGCTFFP
jgi:hypothetical protein